MNIMMVGDISGNLGLQAASLSIKQLIKQYRLDLVIANGENTADGLGITYQSCSILKKIGVQVITTGNHVWDRREIFNFINCDESLLRPANFAPASPGRGHTIMRIKSLPVCVINLAGREHMSEAACPFQTADNIIRQVTPECRIIIIDFHAVSTAEKTALAWYLDGRISCLAGTHTHIQTADERILPQGSAYITDIGMVGPWNSVLGVAPAPMINYYKTGSTDNFHLANGRCVFNAIIVNIEEQTGKSLEIKRIQKFHKFYSNCNNSEFFAGEKRDLNKHHE